MGSRCCHGAPVAARRSEKVVWLNVHGVPFWIGEKRTGTHRFLDVLAAAAAAAVVSPPTAKLMATRWHLMPFGAALIFRIASNTIKEDNDKLRVFIFKYC